MMEKSEKGISPQTNSLTPSKHEGEIYVVECEDERHGNGELRRNLSRRLIHVSDKTFRASELLLTCDTDHLPRLSDW